MLSAGSKGATHSSRPPLPQTGATATRWGLGGGGSLDAPVVDTPYGPCLPHLEGHPLKMGAQWTVEEENDRRDGLHALTPHSSRDRKVEGDGEGGVCCGLASGMCQHR